MLTAEVAPAAPFLVDALPSLILLAALFVIVGLIAVVNAFIHALLGAISSVTSHIPLVGGGVTSAIHKAEQAVTNALGSAEQSFDHHIAAQLHRLAGIMHHMWNVMEQSAHIALQIARFLDGTSTLHDLRLLLRDIRGEIKTVEHAGKVAEREVIRHEKVLVKSVAQGVYPRLRTLEHEIEHVIPREITRTRELAKEAEKEAERAWKLVRTRPWEIGATAFAGAVAIALAKLGLDWIRCNSANSFFKKAGCGFWKLLEDALGLLATLALSIFGVLSPQTLAEEAVSAVDTIEPILAKILEN
jgi:hypothetical protein